MAKINPRLRSFVKLDEYGQVVPGSLIKRLKPPSTGGNGQYYWLEIVSNVCCTSTTTTTTTTT
jgi:hypothetical protein